jgi:hypothetical protein
MAYTAEQLVQLLRNTNDVFQLANELPQFRDGLGDLVSRLGKTEKTLASHDKRIAALEAAQKAAPKPGA